MNILKCGVVLLALMLVPLWGCSESTDTASPKKKSKATDLGIDARIKPELVRMARTPKDKHRVMINVLDEGGKGLIGITAYAQCPDGSRHDATMLTPGLYFVHVPTTCAGDEAGIVVAQPAENRPAQRKPMLNLRQSVSFVLVKQGSNLP